MIRSSPELAKRKPKGNCNVSILTPAQRARKTANDREAQRAIRARTKEYIARLERELAELRSKESCDQTVQELLRRNKAIEKELLRLREAVRVLVTSSPYSAPGPTPRQLSLPDELLTSRIYDGNLSACNDDIPSTQGSPFPGDYNSLPDYSQQSVPLSINCEFSASTASCPALSNVSTPSSSADFIPINVPASTLPSDKTSSSNISAVCDKDVVKMEYDDVGHHSTKPQDLPPPDVRRHGAEVDHTQCLDPEFYPSTFPLHPGTSCFRPYIPHHQQQPFA